MLKLSYYRKKLGLSQIQLAKKLNMSQQTISAYENGSREPDISTIQLLASFFGITTDELLGKEIENIEKDNAFIAFYEGYKDLEDEDKEVIQATINALKKKKDKK